MLRSGCEVAAPGPIRHTPFTETICPSLHALPPFSVGRPPGLQCNWRAIKARRFYNANYALLYRERERRLCCTECQGEYATRKCDTCLDKFCDGCWARIHSTVCICLLRLLFWRVRAGITGYVFGWCVSPPLPGRDGFLQKSAYLCIHRRKNLSSI